MEFTAFPKIGRYSRKVFVTEKIDGTNASVEVLDDGTVMAGSRTRWITPADDNFGFAAWVSAHADELRLLGTGVHYGEWWGARIQRRYGLSEKRFSLFNVSRWADESARPACCGVVPVLWGGMMDEMNVGEIMRNLAECGSAAAPGFMKPEGIVIYHTAAGVMFKKTFEKDDYGKTL